MSRRSSLVHTAVVWVRRGTGPDGMPTVEDLAQEVECRFDTTRREVTLPDGTQISIDATMEGHELEVPVGSAVFRGKLSDLTGSLEPPINVMRVVAEEPTDSYNGRFTERSCSLAFAKGILPSLST